VPGDPTFLLFNLVDDPGETKDISAEHPAIVGQMAKALNDWQQSLRESADGDDY
jgi:hypothetical protein